MVDDPDIWRAANIRLKRDELDVAPEAPMRTDELLSRGDVEGYAVWQRILGAVVDIARNQPTGGERVN